ncbi:probable terpene synthase 9 [Durio zibethinus]|uniref:Probable terpene synthase 9 n=1 Tax=Durio zibethinus TaxID=66656 RepID=A0A6P5WP94_DURZI|nr:probable terpene synthase 9 [Durio zibethinus]
MYKLAHGEKADVFNKFMDSDGKFKDSLREDVDGLLSLYEASYLGQHGEDVLDEAQTFSTKHLKLVMEKLENDLAEQVKESLHVPIYWRLPRMEARNFISIYQKDAKRNFLLLELAKLDFNLLQSVYLKELKELAEWWKDLNIKEKLPFARDRMVECYFWATGSVPEPQFYKCRRNLTKFGSLTTVLDDVYDIYGSMDELDAYTNAVNRWDLEAMEELPEYMKVCYSAMYNHVNEMVEDASNDLGLDILPYIRDQVGIQC